MPLSCTSRQSSHPCWHPTCWASLQRSHTVSSTPYHGSRTSAPRSAHRSIEWVCTRHLTSRHPFVPAAQQLISSSDDNNNRSAALSADHRRNVEWLESITKLCAFILDGTVQQMLNARPEIWCGLAVRDGTGPLTVQSSGSPLKVLKQSANNFFSGDVIPGRYGPLRSACQFGENLCFCKVSKSNKEMFCCSSLQFTVLLTFCFTCFHANQWTMLWINQSNKLSFIVNSLLLSPRFRQNRRQKVFNRGLCVSAGGLRLCGVAWHSKNWQKLHWFIVFHVSIWGGAWSFVWGTKPTKAPPWRRDWVLVLGEVLSNFLWPCTTSAFR